MYKPEEAGPLQLQKRDLVIVENCAAGIPQLVNDRVHLEIERTNAITRMPASVDPIGSADHALLLAVETNATAPIGIMSRSVVRGQELATDRLRRPADRAAN